MKKRELPPGWQVIDGENKKGTETPPPSLHIHEGESRKIYPAMFLDLDQEVL